LALILPILASLKNLTDTQFLRYKAKDWAKVAKVKNLNYLITGFCLTGFRARANLKFLKIGYRYLKYI